MGKYIEQEDRSQDGHGSGMANRARASGQMMKS